MIVGRPMSRIDGFAKVTGRARYAADQQVRGVLHAYLVMSTVARGRITAVNTAGAEAAPGVIAVFTHLNMPRLTVPAPTHGFFKRYLPMQSPDVHHQGQPVALVVARTLEEAQHAATLVEVAYDARRPQSRLEEVMNEAFVPPPGSDGPNELTRGDVAAGMAQAQVRLEAAFHTPIHHHNPIEPSATQAIWDGDRLTVFESTQSLMNTRHSLSQAFGIPLENVRVLSPFLGGGFGAKGPVWPHTILTAAVARRLRRPVKLVLSRAHTYTSNGHRAETVQSLRLGARRDGRITALEHIVTQQVSRTEQTQFNSSEPTRMLYAIPNLRSVQRVARLDLPAQSFMRSPEAVTAHALECTLDELAYELDLDPIEVRLRNHADVNPEDGRPWGSKYLRECYRIGAERFGWSRRDPRPGSMRDGDMLVGWGMATAAHTAGGRPGSGVTVTLGTDGKATVRSATQDIGTGTYTVMTQIAADVLGLPVYDVSFQLGDSDFPEAYTSGASATVPTVGSGVNLAGTRALERLMALATAAGPLQGLPAARVAAADGYLFDREQPRRRVSHRAVLRAHGRPIEVTLTPPAAPLGYSTGATFAEVRIDPRTGRVHVSRIVGVFDPGRVLNRKTLRSQAIGGAIWAIGFTLSEHTLVDPATARIVNANLSGYLVPVNADVPHIDVSFIDKPDPASAALGARGFGETPMTGVTAAIANAVFHATGRRIRTLPITQDRLL
ncbi:xanthine dehydrogenase YagR molybdenum-binding subunit [Thermocatellispora tengchongensis]|uniref:Xanthine dehydrogenase YagR molybdenum-binding subunit n=1 Tax=Thermocatellispora tengchongensis TaxID=1073253 RepID=A0A840PCF1_9ACTN|nr:xanthine dehydrogenase family protein molybdopterin-binding subunit [Thermocatellispora tengchongensis]MBB5137308.1 xanthine dehydrogenase YagR molybdenum-binding subunit [Thermocatellispora tengchongensis]